MSRRLPPSTVAGCALIALLIVAGCASFDGGGEPSAELRTTEPPRTTASTPPASEVGSTTTAPPPTTTTAPRPPPLPTEVGPLQSGSRGTRTKALQEALHRSGFDPGEPDGAFGPKTTMAVWAFQALSGLPRDGVVGPALETQIIKGLPLAMLRPDLGPTHTEVDLDRQVLLVWGDGRLELVTHVSTGSGIAYCEKGHCGSAITPIGDYRFQRRIAGARVAPLGVLYNPVYFVGGIAVHGAGSVPNHPASHGCVRIPMHVSDYFQNLVANGEPVAVFHGGTGAAATVAPPTGPSAPAPAGSENGG